MPLTASPIGDRSTTRMGVELVAEKLRVIGEISL